LVEFAATINATLKATLFVLVLKFFLLKKEVTKNQKFLS